MAYGTGQELLEHRAGSRIRTSSCLIFSMPTMNGLEVTKQLRAAVPHAKIISIARDGRTVLFRRPFRWVRPSYVLKTTAPRNCWSAPNAALKNQRYISPQLP